MPLEHPTAGPGALEQGLTAAAGTTLQKEGTFADITVLMGLITTLTEETSGPYGVRWGVLEDFSVGLERGRPAEWCKSLGSAPA